MHSYKDGVRVLSLAPSGTEIVYALGIGDHLVGVSHTCDYPDDVARLPKVTSRYDRSRRSNESLKPRFDLDVEQVSQLRPTVVITQNVCDVCTISGETVGAALEALDSPPLVLELRGSNIEDLLTSIARVGAACDADAAAAALAANLTSRFARVRDSARPSQPPRVLSLEWLTPFMVAGLWVPDLISAAGGVPVVVPSKTGSRRFAAADLAEVHPDVVIGMPCALDMAATVRALRHTGVGALFPGSKIYAFDGRVPSRHGPRLADVQEAFAEIMEGKSGEWAGVLYSEVSA